MRFWVNNYSIIKGERSFLNLIKTFSKWHECPGMLIF